MERRGRGSDLEIERPQDQKQPLLPLIVPNTKLRRGGSKRDPLPRMASCFCFCFRRRPIIACFVPLFLLVSFLASASASAASVTTTKLGSGNATRRVSFSSEEELRRFRSITARLARLRDASVKTIQARMLRSFFFPGDSKCSDRRLSDRSGLRFFAESRRRRHRLRAGAPAAGVRASQAEGPQARGR